MWTGVELTLVIADAGIDIDKTPHVCKKAV